jgi:hypothetical protein
MASVNNVQFRAELGIKPDFIATVEFKQRHDICPSPLLHAGTGHGIPRLCLPVRKPKRRPKGKAKPDFVPFSTPDPHLGIFPLQTEDNQMPSFLFLQWHSNSQTFIRQDLSAAINNIQFIFILPDGTLASLRRRRKCVLLAASPTLLKGSIQLESNCPFL